MKAKKNPATEQRQDKWLSSENKTCTLLNEHIRFKHHLGTEQSLPKMTPRLQVWLRNKRNNAGGLMLSDLVQPVLTFLQVPNPCCGLAMLQMRRHWRSPWTSPSDSSMGGTNEAAQPCRLAGPKPVCVLLSRTAPKSPACWLVTAMSNHLGVFTWGCSEFRVPGARATTLSAHLSPGSYKWIIHKPILPSEKKKQKTFITSFPHQRPLAREGIANSSFQLVSLCVYNDWCCLAMLHTVIPYSLADWQD